MTLKALKQALADELVALNSPFSNGVLDLTQAEYILQASKKEFKDFLKFLDTPEIYSKIKTIIVNPTNDEKSRFLKVMEKCKATTGIKVVSLNYEDWSPDEPAVVFSAIQIARNKNLKSIVLDGCKTYSRMGAHTPTVVKAIAKRFESVTISNLVIKGIYAAESFSHFVKAHGTKKLKHFALKNITFDFSHEKKEEVEQFVNAFKTQLNNFEGDCASTLESFVVENVQFSASERLNEEYCQGLTCTESKDVKEKRIVTSIEHDYQEIMAQFQKCELLIREAFDNQKPAFDPQIGTYHINKWDYERCKNNYSWVVQDALVLIEKLKGYSNPNSFFGNASVAYTVAIKTKMNELREAIFGTGGKALKFLMENPTPSKLQSEENEAVSFSIDFS